MKGRGITDGTAPIVESASQIWQLEGGWRGMERGGGRTQLLFRKSIDCKRRGEMERGRDGRGGH